MSTYEREWFVYPEEADDLPRGTRLRLGLSARGGNPHRFIVQLEYWHSGAWLQVARFDHDADGPAYRNVERSGLHLDVYHPRGEQIVKRRKWPPGPANQAMGDAEEYLRENAEYYARRFETWL